MEHPVSDAIPPPLAHFQPCSAGQQRCQKQYSEGNQEENTKHDICHIGKSHIRANEYAEAEKRTHYTEIEVKRYPVLHIGEYLVCAFAVPCGAEQIDHAARQNNQACQQEKDCPVVHHFRCSVKTVAEPVFIGYRQRVGYIGAHRDEDRLI